MHRHIQNILKTQTKLCDSYLDVYLEVVQAQVTIFKLLLLSAPYGLLFLLSDFLTLGWVSVFRVVLPKRRVTQRNLSPFPGLCALFLWDVNIKQNGVV